MFWLATWLSKQLYWKGWVPYSLFQWGLRSLRYKQRGSGVEKQHLRLRSPLDWDAVVTWQYSRALLGNQNQSYEEHCTIILSPTIDSFNVCLRADVSYFLCCTCNKGNRRRLHAGKFNVRLRLFSCILNQYLLLISLGHKLMRNFTKTLELHLFLDKFRLRRLSYLHGIIL